MCGLVTSDGCIVEQMYSFYVDSLCMRARNRVGKGVNICEAWAGRVTDSVTDSD